MYKRQSAVLADADRYRDAGLLPVHGSDITKDLREAAAGDRVAADRVWVSVYDQLRRLAHRRLSGERDDHTLSTTGLVHEAYLKLVPGQGVEVSDQRHFMALASRAMRQILVDYARTRTRKKRGGARPLVTLDERTQGPVNPAHDPELILALDEALSRLAADKPRLGEVVELRFFAGLREHEIAEILDVSTRTVERDWQRARAYLYRLLASDEEPAR